MNKIFMMAVLLVSAPGFAATDSLVVAHNLECVANGHSFRIGSTNSAEQWVDSRLALQVVKDKDGEGYTLKEYIGHVSLWKFLEKKTGYLPNLAEAEIYQLFVGENITSSLSTRAKSYPDAKYIRFNHFDSNISTSQDGGGMNGTLVIGKTPLAGSTAQLAKYDAHYIMQHGDHTGGTIDYSCIAIR